jgi:hypothetical protein
MEGNIEHGNVEARASAGTYLDYHGSQDCLRDDQSCRLVDDPLTDQLGASITFRPLSG